MNKIKISPNELKTIYLNERYPAIDVVKDIRLPGKSNILDHIDLSLTPYLVDPIKLIGNSNVLFIGMVAPTQSGKTVFLQVAVADTILQSPVSSLYIMPDLKNGARAFEEKIIAMIKASPKLLKHAVTPYKQTLTQKAIRLDHMSILGAGSNSLGDLSSIPYGRIFLDEVRLFKEAIGKESNAIKLATDRLTTFRKYGMAQGYLVSTPSEEGDLLDQQLTIPNTRVLRYYSLCPNKDCGKYQILKFFENIKYNRKTKTAHCLCKYCQAEFSEDKSSWLKYGKYAKEGLDGATKLYPYNTRERMFFRFSSLESPFRSFQMIWDEYILTKDRVVDYKNFIQGWMAEFWQNTISKTTATELRSSAEDTSLPRGVVPEWTKVLTAGADTQDDGFYVVVRAWGAKRKTHVVDAFFIPCKMTLVTADELATALKQVEDAIYSTSTGTEWSIVLFPLDSGGHRTEELYTVAPDLNKMTLIKGRNNQQETVQYSKGVQGLYLVRTADYLEETEASMLKDYWTVFGGADEDFYSQYVSVKKIVERNKKTGANKVIWAKTQQDDYRMADVHSYIALDIPFADGSLRRKLQLEGWSHNPLFEAKVAESDAQNQTEVYEDFDDAEDDFGGDFYM